MEIEHGTTSAWTNHGCRCDDCRVAWNTYCRNYRKRKATGHPSDCECKQCHASRQWDRARSRFRSDGAYDKLYANQGGCCAICGRYYEVLHIDHIHGTLLVRGLLCQSCNTGLGKLGDDLAGLQRAVAYLQNDPVADIPEAPRPRRARVPQPEGDVEWRAGTHCKNGHLRSEFTRFKGSGERYCAECKKEHDRRYRENRRLKDGATVH